MIVPGWVIRHPLVAALAALWLICLMWAWPWLPPVLAVTAAVAWVARAQLRRRVRLITDAEQQHALVIAGDARGVYGNYPPAAWW